MRNVLIMFVVVGLLAGCDSKKKEEKYGGVMLKNQSQDFVAQGVSYLEKKDIKNAIFSFERAIKEDPTNVSNYVTLGEVYMRLNDYTNAAGVFAAAIKIDPNNGQLYYLCAFNKALAGEREEAVLLARKSVDIFSVNKDDDRLKMALALMRGLIDALEQERAGAPSGEALKTQDVSAMKAENKTAK